MKNHENKSYQHITFAQKLKMNKNATFHTS